MSYDRWALMLASFSLGWSVATSLRDWIWEKRLCATSSVTAKGHEE